MGRTSSKLVEKPTNPLQELQWQEERQQSMRKKHDKEMKKRQKMNKKKKKIKRKRKLSAEKVDEAEEETIESIDNYMKQQYESNLCAFVTNQIAFSTEFYANFERDTKRIFEQVLAWENQLNGNLEDHSVLFTNILQYSNSVDDDDNEELPLPFQRIYIVFENIEMCKANDANYDCISTLCKVNMETQISKPMFNHLATMSSADGHLPTILRESTRQGFLRLRLLAQRQEVCNESEETSLYKNCTSSSGYGSESDYDYVYRELKLDDVMECGKQLPASCSTYLMDFMQITKYARKTAKTDNPIAHVKYLNSSHFMHYFGNLFRSELAPKLAISSLNKALYCAGGIYTPSYEIVPAIYVPENAQGWPACASKFKTRKRPLVRNCASGLREPWPTNVMIKQIEAFGCHLVPLGYAPKRATHNPLRTLEWCIVFPKAERFLLQQLTRPQIKVLHMSQLLITTVGASFVKRNLLNLLQTHLLWCCERHFAAWPEQLVGDVLVKFITLFRQCVEQKRLCDFFIPERNLFENVADHVLCELNAVLMEILSNPLLYLYEALKTSRTQYLRELYPQVNFRHIFALLVIRKTPKLVEKFQEIEVQNQKWCERKQQMQEISVAIEETNTATTANYVDDMRGPLLCEILQQQLLDMAEKAICCNSLHLVTSLVAHARRLCQIYRECQCNKYLDIYESIMDRIQQQAKELKPQHQNDLELPSPPNLDNVVEIECHVNEHSDA